MYSLKLGRRLNKRERFTQWSDHKQEQIIIALAAIGCVVIYAALLVTQ